MKRFFAMLGVLALLGATAVDASAMVVDGVSVNPTTKLGGQTLVLNGAGLRIKYVVAHVYVGALYTPQKTQDGKAIINSSQPRRMVLTMVRDIDVDDLYKSLVEGMQNNTSQAGMNAMAPQIKQVKQGFDSVKSLQKGDVVTMDFIPGKGTTIAVRGKPFGTVSGDNFSHALLAIWLGDKPVQPDMKAQLLGASAG